MEETSDSTVSGAELLKFLGPPVNPGEEVDTMLYACTYVRMSHLSPPRTHCIGGYFPASQLQTALFSGSLHCTYWEGSWTVTH